MQRYPADLVVSVDDFRDSNWQVAVAAGRGTGYEGMWDALSDAARSAMDAGQIAIGKVLWLLSIVCSMVLQPSSANEPFKPLMAMNGSRTALPGDFAPSDIEFFGAIVEETADPWLQARLADVIWIVKKNPRSPRHALMAIDAYRRIPLDAETWSRGGDDCWERAIGLTKMLGDGAGDRLREIESEIVAAVRSAGSEDGFLAVQLADLLARSHLALGSADDIAGKLESFARLFDGQGDLHAAKEYSRAAASWFRLSNNMEKATDATAFLAEECVKEAVARSSPNQPSHAVAAYFYGQAIKTYRSIPRAQRASREIDARIADLRRSLKEESEKSMEEMRSFVSDPIDITRLAEIARHAVGGKSALDALFAFTNTYPGARVAELRRASEETLREHSLGTVLPVVFKSADGRVVASRPALRPGDTSSQDYQEALQTEMQDRYAMEIGLVARSYILPALETMTLEHRLREADFLSIAEDSPIVPSGRERLFAKALFAGYERDFVVSLHLLVPQIEHLVRYHLKAVGARTSTLNEDGTETENALGALVDLPQIDAVFGENLRFELKALLCDPRGPNLRNDVAHGLLDDELFQSAYAVYAWWFGLKLVLGTLWVARQAASAKTDSGDRTETGQQL